MRSRRDEFTDRDKAEIFVRDRALCSYSGKSLWLLDYGAAPGSIDWVDHIVPASKGGRAVVENGLCASWVFNKLKRDVGGTMPLFIAGLPTADFLTYYEIIPEAIGAHLQRFAALHFSDWFYNRAVFQVLLAAAQEGERRADGKPFARGLDYRCKAAMKYLVQWAKFVDQTSPADFASRALLPRESSLDHELLTSLTKVPALPQIVRVASELAPYKYASWQACVDLSLCEEKAEATELLARVEADPFVVPRVRRAVRHNISMLWP